MLVLPWILRNARSVNFLEANQFMANVSPVNRSEVEELEPFFKMSEASMGFLPNSLLTMAHLRQLPPMFSMFVGTVFGADPKALLAAMGDLIPEQSGADKNLPPQTIQLIAYACSLSAGCRYCQAHTSHNAHRQGLEKNKIQSVLDYEDSTLFDSQEKAVIAIALAAGQVPNETDESHFEALRVHYDERQIVQIVSVISVFGFLNRWNDTMATQLEGSPTDFAQAVLAEGGWELDKHAG